MWDEAQSGVYGNGVSYRQLHPRGGGEQAQMASEGSGFVVT